MPYVYVLLSNLAAFLPVWLGHWSVFALLGLYWFENVVIGVLQFLKMRAVERVQGRTDFGMASFFAVHYGMFTLVHGIFVLVFFGVLLPGAHEGGAALWWLSAVVVAFSLASEYRRNFVRTGAARHANQGRLMFEPYGRVFVLHLVVLGGGWLALSTQEPRMVMVLLVALKLVVELWQARRKAAPAKLGSVNRP